ncbi:SDR family oxidoreductase [Micromonospora sp. NBC_01699]|uniref:SDR family NAD(P)-dependent oxidoreductase n=1 Tax=Micromonospora sp. NBC_01699 TaxID=2975984 RepID=UPI002E2D474F|nr:SDR family oxidoreductase [Micromonospora sp. NBC_01699]
MTETNRDGRGRELVGRVALVTGASRGIGQAIAIRLATAGAAVAVHYGSDETGAKSTLAAVESVGGTGFLVRAELGVEGDVDTVVRGFEAGLSGGQFDILVNNAAAAPAGSIDDTTPEQFDHLFAVNVKAPYFLVRRLLPALRDGGRIITISSVATRMANTTQTSFAMTKGAIETMSRTLANELGVRGITVNAVAPGATRTATNGSFFEAPGFAEFVAERTALNRLGDAADIADIVAFLASDNARWITGQVLDASGGLHLGPRLR